MSWNDAKPLEASSKQTGPVFRVGLKVRRDGSGAVVISMSRTAQQVYFGGPLAGQNLHVQIGRAAHDGKLRIAAQSDSKAGTVTVAKLPHGAAQIRVASWLSADRQPKESQKPQPVATEWDGSGVILTLPDWAQAKSALAAEHDVAPVPRRAAGEKGGAA